MQYGFHLQHYLTLKLTVIRVFLLTVLTIQTILPIKALHYNSNWQGKKKQNKKQNKNKNKKNKKQKTKTKETQLARS